VSADGFRRTDSRGTGLDAFGLVADDWMLVTAGTPASWNTMTASWGGFGHLWNKDVAFTFVRPTRHTFSFMEANPRYTLSFFDEPWRAALNVCGSVSGRDHDKAAITGLEPFEAAPGAVAFAQARLVLVCRILHRQDLDPAGFADPAIHGHYRGDYHRLYVGEVTDALVRDGAPRPPPRRD